MKRFSIPAGVVLVISIFAGIGSVTFLGSCVHEDGMFSSCNAAGRMLLGVWCLMAALAAMVQALGSAAARSGLFLAMLPAAVLGMLAPGVLIPLCKMDTMRCRALMRPSMTLLFAAVLIIAAVGFLLERRAAKKEAKRA